jgi:hypothetical protein
MFAIVDKNTRAAIQVTVSKESHRPHFQNPHTLTSIMTRKRNKLRAGNNNSSRTQQAKVHLTFLASEHSSN